MKRTEGPERVVIMGAAGQEYNEFRPHSSLGEKTPEQFLGSGDWVPRVPT